MSDLELKNNNIYSFEVSLISLITEKELKGFANEYLSQEILSKISFPLSDANANNLLKNKLPKYKNKYIRERVCIPFGDYRLNIQYKKDNNKILLNYLLLKFFDIIKLKIWHELRNQHYAVVMPSTEDIITFRLFNNLEDAFIFSEQYRDLI